MKKSLLIICLSIFLFIPSMVFGAELTKTCKYENDGVLVHVNMYDNGKVKSKASLVKNGTAIGQYFSETEIANEWTDTNNCPLYVLTLYPYSKGATKNKFYVSNNQEDLTSISKEKGYTMIDFANYTLTDAVEKGITVGQILSFKNESVETEASTISCPYNNIDGCSGCQLNIDFFKNGTYYDVGESVVSDYTFSSNISSVEFVGEEWNKREYNTSLKQTVTPFQEYLGNNFCPDELVFKYDSESKKLSVYVNAIVEEQKKADYELDIEDPYTNVTSGTANCDSLGLFLKDLQSIFNIIKIVAPILVIVFSIYDFIKALAGKVDGEIKKAFTKLIKRIIFAIILFFLPTVLNYFLKLAIPGYEACITG